MGSVSLLRAATVDAKTFDPKSQRKNGVETPCRVIRLQAALEAENIRLRQLVVELLLDASSLREALNHVEPRGCRTRPLPKTHIGGAGLQESQFSAGEIEST